MVRGLSGVSWSAPVSIGAPNAKRLPFASVRLVTVSETARRVVGQAQDQAGIEIIALLFAKLGPDAEAGAADIAGIGIGFERAPSPPSS